LGEQPRKGKLTWGAAFALRDCLDPMNEIKVVRQVVGSETWVPSACIRFGQACRFFDFGSQQAAAQWRVSYEGYAEFSCRRTRILSLDPI